MRITASHYKQALRVSRSLLRQYKTQLNNINVYPVPDGDTGTNLFMTIDYVWSKVKSEKTSHFGEFAMKVAEAAMEGAQGNSGNILAMFLYGLAEYSQDKEYLTPEDLVYAFEIGTEYAYSAVDSPKEGTILTAMRATVKAAKREIENGNQDLGDIMSKCIDAAIDSLRESRVSLPELIEYDVLDSGGLGFILLLKAWNSTFGKMDQLYIELTKKKVEVKLTGGKCINLLVRLDRSVDLGELKAKLRELGDSIAVNIMNDKLKVHIHSFHLDEVEKLISQYGQIINRKISDI